MYRVIFILFIVKTESIIQLNQIQNANWVLNSPYIDNQYINISDITCEQCLCRMLEMNNLTTSVVCQENQMTCQLFFWNATAQLRIDTNSVIYFLPIPQSPQTTISQESMSTPISSEASTTATTTTTTSYCATNCTGSYTNYDNTTTCGQICVDIGGYMCQSSSTYCADGSFAFAGSCDADNGNSPCPIGYCCVYDTYSSSAPYICLSCNGVG